MYILPVNIKINPQYMSEDSSQWEWSRCTSEIIKCDGQTLKLHNNQPITFENKQYNLNFNVKLWKPFHFSAEIGWNWHKSWNMPEIECAVNINDDHNQSILNQVNLLVTCYVTKTNYQSMALQSVGCKGCPDCEVRNGICVFKSLKFSTTSYKNEYQKFQLVVVLSQMVEKQVSILQALISPCIFVDSRKHARIQIMNQSIQLIVDPFLPENLEKDLVKKQKKNKPNSSQKITERLDGLISYFTAQNIRHKIKHPLFLAMRFHSCVKLFLNEDSAKNEVITEVQRLLMKQGDQRNQNEKQMALLFDLSDCNNDQSKKILDILSILENDYFGIFTKRELIPEKLVEISNIQGLKNKYKQLYPNLIKSKYSNNFFEQQAEPKQQKFIKTEQKESEQQMNTQIQINCQQSDYFKQYFQYYQQHDHLLQQQQWQWQQHVQQAMRQQMQQYRWQNQGYQHFFY